jgi:tetratricopeptide (TPR) repeat protein
MRRDLDSDLKILRTVLQLAQARDFPGAAKLARETLAGGFEHPVLLNVVATQLEHEGKFDLALPLLERAVTISPNDVGALNALGLCLQRLDRPAEALTPIDHLLKLEPGLAFAHASKGNALIAVGSLGRARQSHLRAFELQPENFAATAALASIATHRGQHAEARIWAERALAAAPGFPDAALSLAAADLAEGALVAAEGRLQSLILDSRAGVADRTRAMGLLGDVLDAQARYAAAFDAYTSCNQSLRQMHARFERENVPGYMQSLIHAVEADGLRLARQIPAAQRAVPAAGHVFLLGFPRSGTTLIEVALEGNPDVVALEEHELLADGVLAFMREPVDFRPLLQADDAQLDRLRDAYWRRVGAAGASVAGKLFIDKHPLNTLKLPLISRLFPQAKILFAVRDPRDVVLSCFRRRFHMNPSMYQLLTLPDAAQFYAGAMQFAHRARSSLDVTWHEVRYEKLVASFEAQMKEVCAFIGLEWTAAMGDFATRVQAREYATPSTAQLSQGLRRSANSSWRHYETPMQAALPLLKPWLEHFAYG